MSTNDNPIIAEVRVAREDILTEYGNSFDSLTTHGIKVVEEMRHAGWNISDRPIKPRKKPAVYSTLGFEPSIVREEPENQ